jgi:transposase
MWEFRRSPQDLSDEEKAKLEGLFQRLPRLRALYEVRVRFQRIFDTAPDRRKALRSLVGLFLDLLDHFPEMDRFIRTFEAWQQEILNYFDARQTSGPVEGINNKARVIVKRAYGLKSADSLWTRLVLDLNRAKDVVVQTIEQIRELVAGFRVIFS